VLTYPVSDMKWFSDISRHGDAYRDHALIWQLFPGDDVPRDFIFRRDFQIQDKLVYYIVSKRKPLLMSTLFQVQTKEYHPVLEQGEWLQFDVRANPTVTKKTDQKSARHDVVMDAKKQWQEQMSGESLTEYVHQKAVDWLINRADKWGVIFDKASLKTNVYNQHVLSRKKQKIAFSSLDYQGAVQVIDPLRLQQTLYEGIGHSKAFGCGLLLVKRVA
jgi:CRISPR system Cascade subunit CasE